MKTIVNEKQAPQVKKQKQETIRSASSKSKFVVSGILHLFPLCFPRCRSSLGCSRLEQPSAGLSGRWDRCSAGLATGTRACRPRNNLTPAEDNLRSNQNSSLKVQALSKTKVVKSSQYIAIEYVCLLLLVISTDLR